MDIDTQHELLLRISKLLADLDLIILRTETSEARDALCDANLNIMLAEEMIRGQSKDS